MRRRRAITLLYATTMQKVVWPATTERKPRSQPKRTHALRSATPVTMPGSAIGRTARKPTLCLPKKSWRCSANASIVPSTTATTIATRPIRADDQSASRALSTSKNVVHHRVVQPRGGHTRERAELNERTKTSASGRYSSPSVA